MMCLHGNDVMDGKRVAHRISVSDMCAVGNLCSNNEVFIINEEFYSEVRYFYGEAIVFLYPRL